VVAILTVDWNGEVLRCENGFYREGGSTGLRELNRHKQPPSGAARRKRRCAGKGRARHPGTGGGGGGEPVGRGMTRWFGGTAPGSIVWGLRPEGGAPPGGGPRGGGGGGTQPGGTKTEGARGGGIEFPMLFLAPLSRGFGGVWGRGRRSGRKNGVVKFGPVLR